MRVVPLLYKVKIAVVDVHIAPGCDERRPATFSMVVQAPGESAIDRFRQTAARLIDVVDVQTSLEAQPPVDVQAVA